MKKGEASDLPIQCFESLCPNQSPSTLNNSKYSSFALSRYKYIHIHTHTTMKLE